MTPRRVLGALLLVAVVLLGGATPAAAHAELEASTPSDGARLDAAPESIALTFTERVSVPANGMRVLASTGERVDTGAVDVEGDTVTAGVQPGLGDGTYIVAWRAISADSHPINGAFTFVVGDGPAATDDAVAAVLDDDSDETWLIFGFEARMLGYAGVLVAAGGALYLAIVAPVVGGRLPRLVVGGAAAGLAGLLLHLPIQAHLATDLGAGALFRDGVARQILDDGVGLALALTTAGLVAVLVGLRLRPPARPVVLATGAAVAAGAFAATGHTTQTDPVWGTTLLDTAHAAAAAAWFGGLVLLAVSLRRDDAAEASTGAVVRFSRLATVAVLVIGATGLVLGWQQVLTRSALTSTAYGWTLIAKVAVVAVVVLIGAFNRLRLVPAVRSARDERRARAALRWTVAVEGIALVVAVGLTAGLVNATPGRNAVTAPFSATEALGDATANLVVDPPKAGTTTIDVFVLDDRGQPTELPDGSEVTLDLRLPSAQIGPIERVPLVAGPGHYQLDGSDLSVPGTWDVTVSARVSRFDVDTASFEVPIRP